MRRIIKLIFLPLLSVGLLTYVFLNSMQPKLGLDLQGGISVILTAEEDTDKIHLQLILCWVEAELSEDVTQQLRLHLTQT